VSNKALDYVFELDLPPTDKFVLIAIADRVNDKRGGVAWPSIPRLVAMTGYDRRTVQKALRRLQDSGHLEVVEKARGRRSARYRIRRGGAAPPQTEPVEAAEVPLEAALVSSRGGAGPPKPSITHREPSLPAGEVVRRADGLVARWCELTSTPLTKSIRKRSLGDARDFIENSAPELLDNLDVFLVHAQRAGCRSIAGLPHFVPDWVRSRVIAGGGLYPVPGPVEEDEWEPPEDVAAAIGREPGESVAEMLRRRNAE
jgi:hypothetical protein